MQILAKETPSEFTVVTRLLNQIIWTLSIYLILRLLFATWNFQQWYQLVPPRDFIMALADGIRFDLSIIVTLSSVLLIAALIPWPGVNLNLKSRTLTFTFALIHTPFLLPNIADAEFIHFVGRRFSFDSLFLVHELDGKILALIATYWPLALGALLISVFYLVGLLKIGLTQTRINLFSSIKKRVFVSALLILIFGISGRGGLQLKPLELAHAMTYNDARLSHLVLNSTFTFAHSSKSIRLKPFKPLSEEDMLASLNQNTPGESLVIARPKNIVLIILESFSAEYVGYLNQGVGFTPFLDELSAQSLNFSFAFANGKRSIEALPSLFLGLPSLMSEPLITSPYQDIQIPALPKEMAQKGISSAFFHGGKNGTMFFDQFAKRIGFQKYFGASEYPNATDADGVWGIWDEPFFQFTASEISKLNQPFFATLFSLSSHHPFNVPPQYEGKFPSGDLEIHKTIAYTDYALRKFFEKVQSESWYFDTLFIITADHTSKNSRPEYDNFLGQFRIPLLMFWPNGLWSDQIDVHEPVQQADIAETIKTFFNLESPTFKFSRSLIKSGPRNVTLFLNSNDALVSKTQAITIQENSEFRFYQINSFNGKMTEEISANKSELERVQNETRLKAQRQYFNSSLIENKY